MFKKCRKCGAITAAAETKCPRNCGGNGFEEGDISFQKLSGAIIDKKVAPGDVWLRDPLLLYDVLDKVPDKAPP